MAIGGRNNRNFGEKVLRCDSNHGTDSPQVEKHLRDTSIELTKIYTVAANDFMATGGDMFSGFNDPAIVDKKDTGMLVRDVFIAAAKAQTTVTGGYSYVYALYAS